MNRTQQYLTGETVLTTERPDFTQVVSRFEHHLAAWPFLHNILLEKHRVHHSS